MTWTLIIIVVKLFVYSTNIHVKLNKSVFLEFTLFYLNPIAILPTITCLDKFVLLSMTHPLHFRHPNFYKCPPNISMALTTLYGTFLSRDLHMILISSTWHYAYFTEFYGIHSQVQSWNNNSVAKPDQFRFRLNCGIYV